MHDPAQPHTPPVALTIAGSDSSGGAGIQADIKTFTALRCFGASAITAITAQNTQGVVAAELLDPAMVEQQIEAVAVDLPVAAVKTGMLGSSAIIETVVGCIERFGLLPFVLDPVMIAKSGDPLIDQEAVATLVDRLLPLATLVTPNRHEAARLIGADTIETVEQARLAAERLCSQHGARACVIKGVYRHDEAEGEAVDIFFDGEQHREFARPWHVGQNTHGSGCTFSAALTAALAAGAPLPQALETAKSFIQSAIEHELQLGQGTSPVNHLAWLEEQRV